MARQQSPEEPARSVTRRPSLDDPLPETRKEILNELEYWMTRQADEPNAKDAESVLHRILRLRAEMGEFDTLAAQSKTHSPSSSSDRSVSFASPSTASSSEAAISPFTNSSAPASPEFRNEAASTLVSTDSPFGPSDAPAPPDPWAESLSSSFASPSSPAPHQARTNPFTGFKSSAPAKSSSPLPNPGQAQSSPGGYVFSQATRAILERANALAIESGRQAINTSCILFGFAETAGEDHDTTWLVRNVLGRNANYLNVFSQFLNNRKEANIGELVEGLPGRFSRNACATLDFAAAFARRAERDPVSINPRHLFAALLGAQSDSGEPSAREFLREQGNDLTALCKEYFQFVTPYITPDNQAAWLEVLKLPLKSSPDPSSAISYPSADDPAMTPEAAGSQPAQAPAVPPTPSTPLERFIAGTPGYTSEFCGIGGATAVTDNLGVDELARTLAELIVLRETRLPLAVGLFGNWGTGKSHFMNLMDQHMRLLANPKNPAKRETDKWCVEIVPIYFNAWHYSDSNLWASLVTEIFDKLFDHIRPKAKEFELLQEQLKEAGGVATLARQEVRNAQADVDAASLALENARERATEKEELLGLLMGFRATLSDNDSDEIRKRIAELLGVSEADATLAGLAEKRTELSSFVGQARELWSRATAREGMATRFAWLSGAVLAIVVLRVVLPRFGPTIKDEIDKMKPAVQALFVLLSAAIGWLTPAFGKVKQVLDQLKALQKKAQEKRENAPRFLALQNAIAVAESNATAAQATLTSAEAREKQLSSAVTESLPERQLSNFLEGRAKSADYRDQLGLVSLARRDFKTLSDIFTDTKALSAKKEGKSAQEAKGLQDLSNTIDRVVLFIDDLDRC